MTSGGMMMMLNNVLPQAFHQALLRKAQGHWLMHVANFIILHRVAPIAQRGPGRQKPALGAPPSTGPMASLCGNIASWNTITTGV